MCQSPHSLYPPKNSGPRALKGWGRESFTMIAATKIAPLLLSFLRCLSLACPLQDSNVIIETPVGLARGIMDVVGTTRFSVQYATANRWEVSTVVARWNLPSRAANAAGLPLPCPQPGLDSSNYTEDCLSMVLYVPRNIQKNSATLIWIPGGSFIIGSATDPGLDGSNLAFVTNSIVAVVQCRLGALGFLSPDGKTNFAVQDAINAMKFIKTVTPLLGGSSDITLAGQSSGATMIRALLATPSANSLFKSAIIHSDPMDYGFLSITTQQRLQSKYNSLIDCTSSNRTCWDSLSLDVILEAQNSLFQLAYTIDPSTGTGEPMRPVKDGVLITSPLDSTAPFPPVSKPLMISTVLNDAGPAIYGFFTSPLSESDLEAFCNASLGPVRTSKVINSAFYRPMILLNQSVDARDQLEPIATDGLWKCASWTFARNWVHNGGTAYVGLYTVGATYPPNAQIPFCEQAGVVCHQDDIMIVFGTVPNPTPAQSSLISEVQQRYKAFIYSGNPNAQGLEAWAAVAGSTVNAHNLGGSGSIPIGACEPTFWGQRIPYDYQVYGI